MNTAQDIVAYLLASTGGGAQDGEHQAVRQAVVNGVREVMQCREWLWHMRTGSFTTNQITTTGSLVQGSKQVTVANPTGFVPGRVVGVGAQYFPTPVRIAAVSGNVVTLDVAASQTVSGVSMQPQTYYDLPPNLKDIDMLTTNTVGTLHMYITPQEWQRLEINTRGAGEPYYYTIMRSDTNPDRYQVRFVGVPVNSTVVHYTWRIRPQPIKYMGYERLCRQGTVAVDLTPANIPRVTGTGTAFPQDVAGCYIRFGAEGMDADPATATVPFVMERRIEQWNSKTELLLSSLTVPQRTSEYRSFPADEYEAGVVGTTPAEPTDEFDGGVIGSTSQHDDSTDAGIVPVGTPSYAEPLARLPAKTKYAITDVIDASPHMYTAILSGVEMWYARIAGKTFDAAMAAFNRDLRIAMENDVISPRSGRNQNTWYPTPRSMGWHSPLRADIE